jgi:hypothetical protein
MWLVSVINRSAVIQEIGTNLLLPVTRHCPVVPAPVIESPTIVLNGLVSWMIFMLSIKVLVLSSDLM